jgi:hypothetical protein
MRLDGLFAEHGHAAIGVPVCHSTGQKIGWLQKIWHLNWEMVSSSHRTFCCYESRSELLSADVLRLWKQNAWIDSIMERNIISLSDNIIFRY